MSRLQQLKQFASDVDKKNKEFGNKYLGYIILPPIMLALSVALVSPPVVPYTVNVHPIFIFLLNGYFLSTTFLLLSLFILIFVSAGLVSKPHLQKPIDNAKSIFEFIVNSPNKKEILQILELLEDIIKKNAIQGYLSLAQIFESLYKRIGKVEDRQAEFEKIYMDERRKDNIRSWNVKWNNTKSERERKEDKELIKKIKGDLQTVLSTVAESKAKISELEKEIKKIKGDKDPEL